VFVSLKGIQEKILCSINYSGVKKTSGSSMIACSLLAKIMQLMIDCEKQRLDLEKA